MKEECLKTLQKAFNNIKSVDSKVLSRWTKYRIYLRMNFVYNLISEVGCSEESKKVIDDILGICRRKEIIRLGKRAFIKELNKKLDLIIRRSIKFSKVWSQIRLSAIFFLLTYFLAGLGNALILVEVSYVRSLLAFFALTFIGLTLYTSLRWVYSRDFIALTVILSVLLFYSAGSAYVIGNYYSLGLSVVAIILDVIAIGILMKNRSAFK